MRDLVSAPCARRAIQPISAFARGTQLPSRTHRSTKIL